MTHAVLDTVIATPPWRGWLNTAMWVGCGLLTAGFMLRYARNVRIADMRGAGQYRAVAEPVVRFAAPAPGWLLLVRGDVGPEEAAAACAAAARLGAAGRPTSLARVGPSATGHAAGPCAGVPTLADGAADMQAAGRTLANGGLSMLLVDESGRYVFGDRSVAKGATVLELFAPQR